MLCISSTSNSKEELIIPEDTQKLCDLLAMVNLIADSVDTYDVEDYVVTFHTFGQHDGELLLSRIRKLATKQLFNNDGTYNLTNIEIIRKNEYDIGPIEYDRNRWTTAAIYTPKGAIYYTSP